MNIILGAYRLKIAWREIVQSRSRDVQQHGVADIIDKENVTHDDC
jgi:hypothetical protein